MKNLKTGMLRYLLAGLWPAGEAAIAAATVNAVRRASREGGRRMGPTRTPGPAGLPDWVPDLVGIGVVTGAGGALAYKVMELLGPAVINHGPVIDEPIYYWTADHQVKWWSDVMERLTKIGNSQPTWGAAGAAAATLAVAWPRRKWVPPAALGTAFVVEKCVTLALRRRFSRPGPPSSPLGTYPSGGVDRVVYLYGLIAYLLWREFSGTPQGKAWPSARSLPCLSTRRTAGNIPVSTGPATSSAGCSTARSCSRRPLPRYGCSQVRP